jgi:hypothetical protein
VDELAVALVDAYMAHSGTASLEEDEVACLQTVLIHFLASARLLAGSARKLYSHGFVDLGGQT